MNAYDIAQTKKLIPLTIGEESLLYEEGIITGSLVFGGFINHISDINVILYKFDVQQIKDYEKKIYIPDEHTIRRTFIEPIYALNSLKYPLNLLFMKNKEEFKKWKKATKLMIKMKEIPKFKNKFKDKKKRIQMFEFLKANFV